MRASRELAACFRPSAYRTPKHPHARFGVEEDASGCLGCAFPTSRVAARAEEGCPMKIDIHIDCTPDEARRFLGLPDISSMQASVVAKIEERMLAAADALAPETMLNNWLSLLPANQERLREMFAGFFKPKA